MNESNHISSSVRNKRESIARRVHNAHSTSKTKIKLSPARRKEIKLTEKELGQGRFILYHSTKRKNLDSILENGIRRQKGHSFVYLSQRPDSWRKKRDGLVTFEVNASGLKKCFTSVFDGLDEILYWGDIPPSRVKVIKVNLS